MAEKTPIVQLLSTCMSRVHSPGHGLVLAFLFAAGCALEPPCRSAEVPDLGSPLGSEVFTGSTSGADNVFEGSCGFDSAPDSAFFWTAPATGRYRFDTSESTLDTVLYVRAGDVCDGEELACDDDSGSLFSSQVDLQLEAGQGIYVIVEGFASDEGSFTVNITELVERQCSDELDDDDDALVDCADPDCGCECPNGVVESAGELPISGSTTGGKDAATGSCGGVGAPDMSLVWTAPQAGRYRFDTEGSDFDTVLYIQTGEVCGGTELACNDDGDGAWSEVALTLDAGEPVIITVDGFAGDSGAFVLNITELPAIDTELNCTDGIDEDGDDAIDCADSDCDCATCPLADLGMVQGTPVHQGSTEGRGDLVSGTCGGDGAADASFTWTAPKAGLYRIDTLGSGFDTVLYLQAGNTCGGTELACNDDTDQSISSAIDVELAAGKDIIISVDGFDTAELGAFVVNIAEVTQ